MRRPRSKVLGAAAMAAETRRLRAAGRKVVLTNGCFDLIHAGHVKYLAFARRQGDVLVVGLNSDRSVRRNKGPGRPLTPQRDRATVVAALKSVDYVVIFNEDEPARLVARLLPDVLVKGRDWKHYVSGGETVRKRGGRVVLAPLLAGRSTSALIRKMAGRGCGSRPE